MKRILLLAIMLLMASGMYAQRTVWHENYKRDFASGLRFKFTGIYSNQLFTNKASNIGVGFGIEKRIGNWISIRESVQINGLKNTGIFDRYLKVMTGINIDFTQWLYLYGDVGAVYNRHIKDDPFGLAFDAGLGAKIPLSNYTCLVFEVGTDRVQNRNKWTSTPSVSGGVIIETPLTENDRININVLENQPKIIEELSAGKKAAEDKVKVYTKTLDTMNQTLVAANEMIGKLRKEILKCEAENNGSSGPGCIESNFPDINFRNGSSSLTDLELDKLISIADIISRNKDDYTIYGFCSTNGSDEVNMKLAEERANKVFNLLVRLGIEDWRLNIIPVGKAVTYGDGSGTINQFVRISKRK